MEGRIQTRPVASVAESTTVENPPGVFRTTLSFNEQTMLCRFVMNKGARIPLHHHTAVQNGYVIAGSVRFHRGDGTTFVATSGTAYVFDSDEPHAADVLERSEIIECFSPMRPEYGPTA